MSNLNGGDGDGTLANWNPCRAEAARKEGS